MATSRFSNVDEYGFQRPDEFDYEAFGRIWDQYLKVLVRRQIRWEQYMKRGDPVNSSRQLKRFIRKGVPSSLRAIIWMKSSGAYASQQQEPDLYTNLVNAKCDEEIADTIKIDLPRTFPDNIYFISIQYQLYNVLIAYSNYNPKVGYCQGLNYIAGLILIVTKNEETTFWLLKHIVEKVTPNYHTKTMSGLVTDIGVLSELIKHNVPDVYAHVRRLGLSWAVIVTKWFICLFAEVMPTETVLRIWDCLFAEGSKILFRVSLTLIMLNRSAIVGTEDIVQLSEVFKSMVSGEGVTDCHEFIRQIFTVPGNVVTRAEIERLRKVVGANGLE